jgi:hypothetical protein
MTQSDCNQTTPTMNLTSATQWLRGLAAGIALVAAATPQAVQAQGTSNKVLIGLAGSEFGNGKSISKTSAPWNINPASTYYYTVDGRISGKGNLAGVIPNGTKLSDLLESVKPGSSSILKGSLSNPSGTLPATVLNKTIKGSRNVPKVGKVTASLTIRIDISATGEVKFTVKNMKLASPAGTIPGSFRFGKGTKVRVSTTPL